MGSGKSTVGQLVGEQTGRHLVDVDVAIARRTGKSVRQLWEEGGEAAYRHLESQEVLDALRSDGPIVLAAPGGAILDPEVRLALRQEFVVWLRATPTTLTGRVRPGDHRPLLGNNAFEALAGMAVDRAHLYHEVADAVIDTDTLGAETVAEMLVELLGSAPPATE
jgi:shikimate kinase